MPDGSTITRKTRRSQSDRESVEHDDAEIMSNVMHQIRVSRRDLHARNQAGRS